MNRFTLTFDIKSDWHIGSGQESGAYADALTLKNEHQLPFIPGKSIKGLLRQAFQTAVDNQWFNELDNHALEQLFGTESNQGEQAQGTIQVSNAQLSAQETEFFQNNRKAVKHLYRVLQSTAIDKQSGVAKEGSLRSIEVAVPMQLKAELTLNTPEHNQQFQQWLTNTITLITEFGAKRHRGLGQVIVSCQVKNKEG